MIFKWLSKKEIKIFIIGFIGTFLARGILLFTVSHSIDDYKPVLAPNNIIIGGNQGRWLTELILLVAKYFGIFSNFSITLNFLFSIVFLVLIGLLICRIWKITNDIIISSIVVLLFTTFPYQAEIYTFKGTSLMFIFSLLIGFLSIYFSKSKISTIILTAIGFSLALGTYQIILNYIIPLLLIKLIIELLRQYKLNNKINKKYFIGILNKSKVMAQSLTVFFGLIIYLITNKIIMLLQHATVTSRADLLSLSKYPTRIIQIKELLIKILFINEGIFPIFTKVLLLVILVLSIFGIIKTFIHKKNHDNHYIQTFFFFISIVILLIISIIANIGVLLVIKEWWPTPRVMIAFGTFWAGIATISYLFNSNKFKKIILVISFIVIISFIGINNHIYVDQIRVNQKDRDKANRIISRLEMNNNFNNVKYISIIGKEWSYGSQITTVIYDMNISAFGADWSQIPLLNEVSGYNFLPSSPEQFLEATKYCNKENNWPSEKSILIKGTNAIICLNSQ